MNNLTYKETKDNTKVNASKLEYPLALANYCNENQKNLKYTTPLEAHVAINLSFLSGLIGNSIILETDSGFQIKPNLYTLLIMSSGEGKSAILRYVKKFVSSLQDDLVSDHRREVAKQKDKSEEELVFPSDVFDVECNLVADNATVQALQRNAAERQHGNLHVVYDEFAGFLLDASNNKNKEEIDFFNTAYETDSSYTVTRKMKDAELKQSIQGLNLTMTALTQNSVYSKYLESYRKKGLFTGFPARFQNIYRINQKKQKQTPVRVDKNMTRAFESLLTEVVQWRVRHSKREKYWNNALKFTLSKEASLLFDAFDDELDALKEKEQNELYIAHLNKTATHAHKNALLFHLLEKDTNLERYTKEVSSDTAYKAINYTKLQLKEAIAIYDVNNDIDIETEQYATSLFNNYIKNTNKSIHSIEGKEGFSSRDLARTDNRYLLKNKGKVNRDQLDNALRYLARKNKLAIIEKDGSEGNRALTRYRLFDESKDAKHDEAKFIADYNEVDAISIDDFDVEQFDHEKAKENLAILKKVVNFKDYVSKTHVIKNKKISCPFHHEKTPSCAIYDHSFYCFACEAKGSIIDFVMKQYNISFKEAVDVLKSEFSLTSEKKSTTRATKIWNDANEGFYEDKTYLRKRLLHKNLKVSRDAIKYASHVYHAITKKSYDCMVAKVVDINDNFLGIHQTFLENDFSKKIEAGEQRLIQGSYKDKGMIKLIENKDAKIAIVGEGIETTLSLYLAELNRSAELIKGHDVTTENVSVYCTMSSQNTIKLERFDRIILAQDADDAGRKWTSKMIELNHQAKVCDTKQLKEGKDYNDYVHDFADKIDGFLNLEDE
jgi:cytochrome c556